ncbi:MAG: hypothetical protein LBI64_02700 [Coriobacteriales bacterium]|jgi:exopolyphosphatase/guanosine-5'-triphosphate,3'-diphosphate pyrophosphatase|nr:hypothetical protein [Coriobacteriales bacterium]
MQRMRLAAIDLGTVTSRLLVADVEGSDIREVERQAIITHLGEGVDATGLIGAAALVRELEACQSFLDVIHRLAQSDGVPVRQISAIATSAMRDAANASLVQAALSAIGLDVEVIVGEREASLSFRGTLSGFPCRLPVDKRVMSVDVGGGSTELVIGCAKGISMMHSFNIGSRRVTDRFLLSDPPELGETEAACHWIGESLAPFFAEARAEGLLPEMLLAVAGTATSAATVAGAIEPHDPERVHGAVLSGEDLRGVIGRLSALPLTERAAVVGLESERAPVVVGGLLVLDAVLAASGLSSFTVSETDILHGILLEAYERLSAE